MLYSLKVIALLSVCRTRARQRAVKSDGKHRHALIHPLCCMHSLVTQRRRPFESEQGGLGCPGCGHARGRSRSMTSRPSRLLVIRQQRYKAPRRMGWISYVRSDSQLAVSFSLLRRSARLTSLLAAELYRALVGSSSLHVDAITSVRTICAANGTPKEGAAHRLPDALCRRDTPCL